MSVEISINGRRIGAAHPPYVIAELSANHDGSFEKALQLVDVAGRCGADAIKLQTYTPETITLDCDTEDFQIHGGLWDGQTLFRLYEKAHTPWDWHKPLFERARERGLTIFSSPFDKTAVDFLEDLNAPAYKIASFEAVDLPLIRYVAGTGKPMIISTGMANREEISEAIEAAHAGGCREIAVLHCVSGYPAPAADYHLKTLVDMRENFGLVTGLSDHTLDNTTAIASVALGANIVEKHFTLDRKGGGADDSFSLEPDDLRHLCASVKTAWESLGRVHYGLKDSERANLKFRRSLYYVHQLSQGDVVTSESVRSVRPGYGLKPKFMDRIVGRRITRAVDANTPVLPSDFDVDFPE